MPLFRHATGYGRGGLKQRTSIDPRRIMLKDHLKDGAVIASSSMPRNWLEGYGVGDLGNSDYGCCAYAGPAHFINTIRMRCKHGDIITREMVLREYAKWTGFDPSLPATDNGAYLERESLVLPRYQAITTTNLRSRVRLSVESSEHTGFQPPPKGSIRSGGSPKGWITHHGLGEVIV